MFPIKNKYNSDQSIKTSFVAVKIYNDMYDIKIQRNAILLMINY